MCEYEKILVLNNEVEAGIMEDILQERGIPVIIQSYFDKAYDGLFTMQKGWGHIEAEAKYKDEIISIYNDAIIQEEEGSQREVNNE